MITDRHIAFARAMVALAREHGMNNLDLTFRQSTSYRLRLEEAGVPMGPEYWQAVRLIWSEGRHGDRSNITFKAEASMEVPELSEVRGA